MWRSIVIKIGESKGTQEGYKPRCASVDDTILNSALGGKSHISPQPILEVVISSVTT